METRITRPASQWLSLLAGPDGPAFSALEALYGHGSHAAEVSRRRLVVLLGGYLAAHGDEPVLLSRAPGRVNIMGRHVDHQGGHVNSFAIDRDVWMVVGERRDRLVRMRNAREDWFPPREFSLDGMLDGYRDGEWLAFLDSAAQRDRAERMRGDWVPYVQAPLARLQAAFRDRPLPGMNMMVGGNIPSAAGLSSSSAVVVAAAEAVVALNGLDVTPERFVELCGEGEWWVGTRGGAGDHAAMKLARQGHVTQIGFFPFGVTGSMPFPAGHVLLVCNSRQEARKTAGVRDTFNHRVACFNLGRELLKQAHPEHAERIHHLRDVNAQALGADPVEVLRMLRGLPEGATRAQLRDMLPAETCDHYFGSHGEDVGPYPIRSVVLYGLAECERARRCPEMLCAGDVDGFGRWMQASHNGDRVTGTGFPGWLADADFDALVAGVASGTRALAEEYGAYACSTPRIDQMVDLALAVPGVVGAQMAGAGLGGCVMALAHADAVDALRTALVDGYYEPLGLDPEVLSVTPVAGSGVLAA